jgi:hypothetical protein
VVDAVHVEQQGAVAKMVGRPAVPTRSDADLVAIGLGVPEGADDVVGVDRLNDHVRVALGYTLVPHGAAAGGFIPIIGTKVVPTRR